MTLTDAAPTKAEERIVALDIIRGFALFGVLLVNLTTHGELTIPEVRLEALPTAEIDRWTGFLIGWLAEGKAQALFSMLFGIGFAVFMERLDGRGLNARRLYLRRALVLTLIGFAHLYLLFIGDILHAYGLLAFVLLFVRGWPSWLLVTLGVLLSLLAWPLMDTWLFLTTPAGRMPALYEAWQAGRAIHYEVFLSGDYRAFVADLARANWVEYFATAMMPAYLAYIFGRFLLGLWLYRQGWLQDAAAHAGLIRRVLPWFLGVGLLLAVVEPTVRLLSSNLGAPIELAVMLAEEASKLTLALGYGALLALMSLSARWARPLSGLAAVGRMALTNYLMQSMVFMFVYYGFGLGLMRWGGPTTALLVAIPVFALQIVLSRWWLARFRYGPMEWLWRSATYGRWQPMSRGAALPA